MTTEEQILATNALGKASSDSSTEKTDAFIQATRYSTLRGTLHDLRAVRDKTRDAELLLESFRAGVTIAQEREAEQHGLINSLIKQEQDLVRKLLTHAL